MCKYIFLLLTAILIILPGAFARLILPRIIGNNMVLQQGAKVAIWGWAGPEEVVTVQFKGQTLKSTANEKGEWKIWLNPMKASFENATLVIKSSGEVVQLNNILVGEVWLCSGQSNMEFPMRKLAKLTPPSGTDWPVNAVVEADNPAMRIFLVERKNMHPDSTHSGWEEAERNPLRSFSAVGYFFAKRLFSGLHVPVGMISACVSGSRIEPWMPSEAMEKQSFFIENKHNLLGRIDGDPGKFYTTMIEPLIPFTMKGVLWYQGESNCFLGEGIQYSYKMKSLIQYWRTQWQNQSLPFYFVQIAPYYYSKAADRPHTVFTEPEFWEAQAAVLKMPHTALISTIDLNDTPSDLHPVNKWDVGYRLGNSALSNTYKLNSDPPMGPFFKNLQKKKNGFTVDFKYKGQGLRGKTGNTLEGFELEDRDGNFKPARAEIRQDKVWVTNASILSPVAVRYAWREDAKPTLFNSEGLPAYPFRSGDSVIKIFH